MCNSYKYSVDIVTEELDNGDLVIFDKSTQKMHVINNTVLIVYRMCAKYDTFQIAEEIKKVFRTLLMLIVLSVMLKM